MSLTVNAPIPWVRDSRLSSLMIDSEIKNGTLVDDGWCLF